MKKEKITGFRCQKCGEMVLSTLCTVNAGTGEPIRIKNLIYGIPLTVIGGYVLSIPVLVFLENPNFSRSHVQSALSCLMGGVFLILFGGQLIARYVTSNKARGIRHWCTICGFK